MTKNTTPRRSLPPMLYINVSIYHIPFFTADILTWHSQKSTGESDNIDDGHTNEPVHVQYWG